jgi:hypothetical protein
MGRSLGGVTESKRQNERGEQQGAVGYAVNGESQYSRRTASGGVAEPNATNRERQSMSRADLLLDRHLKELEKIEQKIAIEPDPAKAGKLVKQQEIKMRFIERLRKEQREQTK